METDWSKVMEVFASGILGVYLVMVLLMVLTQFSNWLIGRYELATRKPEPEPSKEA